MHIEDFGLTDVKTRSSETGIKYVKPGKDLGSYLGRHKEAVRFLMFSLAKGPCDVLVQTEMFRKPWSHADIADIYTYSKESGATRLLILPHKTEDWIVAAHITLGAEDLVFVFDLKTLVSEDFRKTVSWAEFQKLYFYIVNCWTAFNPENTWFFHIDDDTLLEKALANVKSGVFDLPGNEFIYLGQAALSFNWPAVWSSGRVIEWKDGVAQAQEGDPELLKGIAFPDVDSSGLEERFYNLFAFLLLNQEIHGLDTETTGLDTLRDKVVSIGIADDAHLGFYISVAHTRTKTRTLAVGEMGVLRQMAKVSADLRARGMAEPSNFAPLLNVLGDNTKNISRRVLMDVLMPILKTKKLVYHNSKYDYSMMWTETGIKLPIYFDTMVAHYVARPGFDDPHRDKRGLKVIAVNELGVRNWKGDIIKCQAEHKDLVGAYNTRDCCYMNGISYILWPSLQPIWRLFQDVEMQFTPLIANAEREGICLDVKMLKQIEKDLKLKMAGIVKEFSEIGGEGFNINSGQQLSALFFDKMQIVPIRKCQKCTVQHQTGEEKCPKCGGDSPIKRATPAGKPSLDKIALDDMAKTGVEAAKKLKEYRAASKLVTSYTNLDTKVHVVDGHLHPTYNQTRTASGRLSSSSPNFQVTT